MVCGYVCSPLCFTSVAVFVVKKCDCPLDLPSSLPLILTGIGGPSNKLKYLY